MTGPPWVGEAFRSGLLAGTVEAFQLCAIGGRSGVPVAGFPIVVGAGDGSLSFGVSVESCVVEMERKGTASLISHFHAFREYQLGNDANETTAIRCL